MSQMFCYGCMKPKNNTPICEHCGYDDRKRNEMHQLPVGTILQNQYVIGRVLGQGGFGITYIGWDKNLAIPVAIKEFFPSGSVHRQSTVNLGVTCYTGEATEAFVNHRERFLKEARTLAQLSGLPEIVQVRNFFNANNTAYIVMEYVQGITLKGYLRKLGRRMTVQEVLEVMRPVLKALSKVHGKNLIHRDISPDNIMLPDSGGIKLIDFGTVRNIEGGMQTKSTEAILKPGFAPIEQYQSKGNLGPWTDVYALCASIHYCLTGKVPEDALERLENGGALVHLKTVPGITPKIQAALEKGLAVRISDRIQTVDALYEMLYGDSPVTSKVQNDFDVEQAHASATVFGRFKGTVPDQVLNYCESVAHKPILVETYLQQCINRGVIGIDMANQLLSHYLSNKPAAAQNAQTHSATGREAAQKAMEFCTSCGKPIPAGSKFCCQCGTGLPALVPDEMPRWECAKCRSQIPKNSNYCRKCGTPAVNPVIVNRGENVCPGCGVKLTPGSRFCFSCGRALDMQPPVRNVQSHCTNCGKPLTPGAKFCVYCGKPVQN